MNDEAQELQQAFVKAVILRTLKPAVLLADQYDLDLDDMLSLTKMALFEHYKNQPNYTFKKIALRLGVSLRVVYRIRTTAQEIFNKGIFLEDMKDLGDVFEDGLSVDEEMRMLKKIEGMLSLSPSTLDQLMLRMQADDEFAHFQTTDDKLYEKKKAVLSKALDYLVDQQRLVATPSNSVIRFEAKHRVANFKDFLAQQQKLSASARYLAGLGSYLDTISKLISSKTDEVISGRDNGQQVNSTVLRFNAPNHTLLSKDKKTIEPSFLINMRRLLLDVVSAQDDVAQSLKDANVLDAPISDVHVTLTWHIDHDALQDESYEQ